VVVVETVEVEAKNVVETVMVEMVGETVEAVMVEETEIEDRLYSAIRSSKEDC